LPQQDRHQHGERLPRRSCNADAVAQHELAQQISRMRGPCLYWFAAQVMLDIVGQRLGARVAIMREPFQGLERDRIQVTAQAPRKLLDSRGPRRGRIGCTWVLGRCTCACITAAPAR